MGLKLPIVLLCVTTLGFVPAGTRVSFRAVEQDTDRSIYDAVLKSIFRRSLPEKLVIESTPIGLYFPSDADWRSVFREAPLGLRAKLEKDRPRADLSLDVRAFPPGTQLVPKTEIDAVFSAPLRERNPDVWVPFRAKFGVESWQRFSWPVVTDDGQDALVYYEHYCGSLCGEGVTVWLHRPATADPWTVMRKRPFWVS